MLYPAPPFVEEHLVEPDIDCSCSASICRSCRIAIGEEWLLRLEGHEPRRWAELDVPSALEAPDPDRVDQVTRDNWTEALSYFAISDPEAFVVRRAELRETIRKRVEREDMED